MSRYLIVDYERSNFSISQNRWSEDITPQMVPLYSMTDSPTGSYTQRALVYHHSIIRSLVEVTVLPSCMITAVTIAHLYKRRRRRSFLDKSLGPCPETAGVNSWSRGLSIGKALEIVVRHLGLKKGQSQIEGPEATSRPSFQRRSLYSCIRIHWLHGKISPCINKFKLFVESRSGETWNWWPLLPSTAYEGDVLQSQSNSKQSQADSATSRGHPLERPSRATSESNYTYHSDHDDISRKGMDPSAPITAVDIVPPSNFTGFVLFGVHGSQRLQSAYLRLAQIDVSDKDDDGFFDQMIAEFKRLRGFLRRTFSIWVFHTCEFVTVRLSIRP